MQNSLRTSGFAVAGLLAALVVPRLAAADEIRAHLIGYNEVPSINTDGNATFKIKLSKDRSSFDWELSYAGLGADVTQAHIHFGQPAVNGAIVIWLCGNPSDTVKPPKGTQGCPNGINRSATIFGTATA